MKYFMCVKSPVLDVGEEWTMLRLVSSADTECEAKIPYICGIQGGIVELALKTIGGARTLEKPHKSFARIREVEPIIASPH